MKKRFNIIDRKVGVTTDLKNILFTVGGLLLILPILTLLLLLIFQFI